MYFATSTSRKNNYSTINMPGMGRFSSPLTSSLSGTFAHGGCSNPTNRAPQCSFTPIVVYVIQSCNYVFGEVKTGFCFVALFVFGSIIRGSSLNANHYTCNESS